MRTVVTTLACFLVASACSSNDSTTSTSGAGANTTGPTSGTGGSTTSAGGGSTTSSGNGGTGGMPSVCPAGTIICDGNIAKICDGNGGYTSETDCGTQVCVADLGCVDCIPGTGTCNGDTSEICNPDGMGTTAEECDPVQGVTCDPNTGMCVGDCAPQAIGKSYQGCDYYPTITANPLLTAKSVVNYAVAVANTTMDPANLTVTQGANTVTTATIAAGSVQVIPLPWIAALDQASTQAVTDGAYRLRTDKPVTVYQYNPLQYTASGQFTYTNDASLLLPVNAWTGTYRVMARNQWRFTSSTSYPGLYAVTASEDNTTVTLTPSATGGSVNAGAGVAANGTGTVILNEGDVLQVVSTATTSSGLDPSDLTGTLVQADKPVQVIGGHVCTYVPFNTAACDHLEESMLPVETLAKDYFVSAPLINPSTTKVRMVRIVATDPNTTLTYDPPQAGAPGMLTNAGDYAEIALTQADFRITSNNKILVAQYMAGQSAGGGTGDPAMALAVPVVQYRNAYLFHAPTNYEANYVNIVAPTGSTVTLDGNPVTGFTTIGATGYDVARVQLTNGNAGNHDISGSAKFGISVYGYGQYTSYWYPGGLDLSLVAQ